MKVVLITGFVDSRFQYREEFYFKRLKSEFDIYLYSSNFSPPQKFNSIITQIIDSNHSRFKSIIKFKDIVVLPIFSSLRKLNPDIVHIFDAQQVVGLIPFIYAILYKKILIYEHELKEYPIGFLGKIRFLFITKPLIRLYSNYSTLIRVVTPAARNIIIESQINSSRAKSLESKIFLTTLFFSDTIKNTYDLSFGFKSNTRLISICFSGKVDELKFKRLISFFEIIDNVSNQICFNFLMDFTDYQISILNKLLISKFIIFKHFGLVDNEKYYKHLATSDGLVFVNPTISYFEAIGFNLPILVENNAFSSHLNSKNIFKYHLNSLNYDFKNYIENVKNFYYSSDSQFSEIAVINDLKNQYKSLYEHKYI